MRNSFLSFLINLAISVVWPTLNSPGGIATWPILSIKLFIPDNEVLNVYQSFTFKNPIPAIIWNLKY